MEEISRGPLNNQRATLFENATLSWIRNASSCLNHYAEHLHLSHIVIHKIPIAELSYLLHKESKMAARNKEPLFYFPSKAKRIKLVSDTSSGRASPSTLFPNLPSFLPIFLPREQKYFRNNHRFPLDDRTCTNTFHPRRARLFVRTETRISERVETPQR